MQYTLSICDFMFCKSLSQQFCFHFSTSCSLGYPYVNKLHRVPYRAFGPNSFQKLQPPKNRQRQIVNFVMRIQRLHKLQYHRRFSVLYSMLYPLFNKIKRNFNETVCERTRFAKIKTTHLLFTVEGILFSMQF